MNAETAVIGVRARGQAATREGHSKTEIVRLIGRSRHAVDNATEGSEPSSARLSMSE